MFWVSLTAGQVIKFDIDSAKIDTGGSYGSFNALLRLFNSSGTQIASNDNGTDPDTGITSNDSYLTYTVTTSGTYYLGISDASNSSYNPTSSGGGYSMMSGAYLLKVLRAVTNQASIATNDSVTTHHGTLVNVPVLANDSDPNGDALTITTAGAATHGSTQIVTVSGVSQIRYIPIAGYVGPDSFVYKATDGTNQSAAITVPVSVTNFTPWSVNDYFTVSHDRTLTRTAATGVLSNDVDVEDDFCSA